MLAHPIDGLPRPPPQLWTTARVGAMETSEIVANLEALGIRTAPEELARDARRLGSAVAYAREAWIPRSTWRLGTSSRDFVCLAACELWKRWRPDVPSQEMLLELMLLGYDGVYHNDEVSATRHWIRFWEALRPVLTDEVRTTAQADALIGPGGESMHTWGSDLGLSGAIAASKAPELGRRVAEVLGEVLAQFSGEGDAWRLPLAVDRAEALYVSGAREEGERLLQELIAERPRHAGAYVLLASLWAPDAEHDPEAVRRALALLEQAAAVPVDDADSWDLEERMAELRERLAPS